MPTRPETLDSPGRRATVVFGESLGCGYVLGAVGGVIVMLLLTASDPTADWGAVWVWGYYAAGFGAFAGLFVGLAVGIVNGLVVAGLERRLGPRCIASLIPLVALTITLPLAFLFGLVGGTGWVLAIVALDATFTYAGGRLIAHRYLARFP